MKNFSIALLLIIFSLQLSAQDSICPDVDGAIEHSVVKKYNNSCIIGYKESKFDAVRLPTATQIAGKETESITVEGKVIDMLFGIENTSRATVLEVQRNYEQALINSGMKVLFSCRNKNECFKYGNGNFFHNYPSLGDVDHLSTFENQKLKYFRFALSGHHKNTDADEAYFIAQGQKLNTKYTIALLIRYNRSSWKGLTDNIFVFAKIIEEEVMDDNQVTFESIDEKIKNEGKEVFDNIHFDFGSDNLTQDSYVIIEQISIYLNGNPNQKYFIVGHTDNVGSLASNLTLSQSRATAVVDALIQKYQVNPSQISAHGLAQLSPRAANTTEEGRALNRRVEVVLE